MATQNVILLGIGHTNAHVVKKWASEPIADCSLTCISRFPTATYSGMLPGTLGRQFQDDEMRIHLESLAERAGAKLILADTERLDLESGMIHFSDHEPISFNALSVGVGSMPAGWQDHADSPLMVPIKPMQTFLTRLEQHLDGAAQPNSPLRVSVVGGGVASVEIAFCLLQQFAKRDQKKAADLSIEIFTSSDRVADGMSDRSIRRLETLLSSRGIRVRPGKRVTDVGQDSITTEDGQTHQTDCVIWATGAAAPPVLGKLGLQTDDRGFIATSPTLQSLTDPRVFAVGDSGTVIESPSPKAGVYAVRQSPVLWHNLRAFFAGGPLESFQPQSDFLKLLNTGDGKAFLEYGPLSVHSRWCWHLKTWIDKRFVEEYQVA
ncbi:FAD-dependent oxidoreductase [Aporhodopirellula aestuarii]|uniref:FAD-dependent oxidoreductase n=1 Tax=Aporhodopirellula aestuarii TaxID=2950107 RepID=A0ABT0U528_9BACT|nr:FAD-dependent oxidoreductase [Aporhodopirellula aestuarii]MCM2371456.1 FAD-dependent oxidoreductase [Aporhodopirellula aestuarii]